MLFRGLWLLMLALSATAILTGTAHAVSAGCTGLTSGPLDEPAVLSNDAPPAPFGPAAFDAGDVVTLTYTTTNWLLASVELAVTAVPGGPKLSDTASGTASATLTVTVPKTGNFTVTWATGANVVDLFPRPSISVTCTPGALPPANGTTTTSLASSLNPSNVGDSVTFTATIRSTAGTPTGTVTFLNDGATLGSAPLAAGIARLETSDLPSGTHPITARYNPTGAFDPSVSAVLDQLVESDDSAALAQMANVTTKIVAQTSGQSMQVAVDNALNDAFGGGNTLTGDSSGFYMSVGGATSAVRALDVLGFDKRAGDSTTGDRAFAGMLGPVGASHAADPMDPAVASSWRFWTSARNTWWDSDDTSGDIRGSQVNMLIGATYIFTPSLAAGVFGGYETFEYNSLPLDARLAGSGWTGGGYLGWKFLPAYRLDIAVAGTAVDYSGSAGLAAGTFAGSRLFLSTGVTGSHTLGALKVDPSVKLYALWERDGGFVDTLGTNHAARSFSTARLSGGAKVAYPIQSGGQLAFEPFVGIYADYYFSHDDTQPTAVDAIRDGWSARFTGGLSVASRSGIRASVTGELGGVGQGGAPHGSVRGDFSLPF